MRGIVYQVLCAGLFMQDTECRVLCEGTGTVYKVSWYRCCGVLCRVLCARFWIQALCTVCRAVLLSEADPYIRCIQCIFYFGEFVRRGSCCV